MRAGGIGGGRKIAGGAKGDGGEAVVTFFGMGLLVENCEPIYPTAFMRVKTEFGEIVGTVVEGTEESVFWVMQPCRDGLMVAD